MKLPTREVCQAIIKKTDAFFVSETVVEGQKVEMYNYRLASISDFVDNNAFELRGITFVEQADGTWEHNILLNKFFNINQTVGWMYDEVKDKKITRVQNKEDGSIVSFVKFNNGKIRAKSKMSFESEQAVMAQEVYNNNLNLQEFISEEFMNGCTPIFELVSPENQIVLEYEETKLILLQIRDKDGNYDKTIKDIGICNEIEAAEDFEVADNYSLGELLQLKETSQEPIEGWVVTFEDGQMAKIKTNKYLSLHGLISPNQMRENLLVKTILDNNIDDVIAALVPGVKKDKILAMSEKVQHNFNHLVKEFHYLRAEYFVDFNENRKEFALKYSKTPGFSPVMKSLKTPKLELEAFAEKTTKEYILKRCNSLGKAQEYLKDLS